MDFVCVAANYIRREIFITYEKGKIIMAEYQKVEYRIGKDGKIVERVLNATGSSCVETTKGLEKSLGEIESQELLPEYYQDDELITTSENQSLQQQ
ncbi:MAG: DUF2997 domain-containing protein [Aphanizomenon gracile PMC649.10]|nr:DUF2997 domain-containing protein [Aphanizomenon gracile PMC649.10]MDM3858587.1 DUF2997 domain-containing protein [Aphanizomenon gracile PMC644.10]